MDAINVIASRHDLFVIEDAAQSFGALYKERKSCALSTIGSTSFFPSKPLGCYGDGGALFTDDDGLAKAMREIRVHGQDRRYHHSRIGVNSRLDSLQAAVLLAKMSRFEWEISQRQVIADLYRSLLADVPADHLVLPANMPDRTSVFAQFTLSTPNRDSIVKSLNKASIPTAIHYPIPLHMQPAFAGLGHKPGDLPEAERAAGRVFSLPMHPYLSLDEQQKIASALIRAATV
jgi:UDP-2-acetamido-2-deoxy-ribo-hexuluronate aminotransferase